MCFCANVFTPCAVLNARRKKKKKKVRGLYFGNRLKRKEHPREDPRAILGSPLPGGEAIKPYPESRKKRQGEKSPPKAFNGMKEISYVNSSSTLRS